MQHRDILFNKDVLVMVIFTTHIVCEYTRRVMRKSTTSRSIGGPNVFESIRPPPTAKPKRPKKQPTKINNNNDALEPNDKKRKRSESTTQEPKQQQISTSTSMDMLPNNRAKRAKKLPQNLNDLKAIDSDYLVFQSGDKIRNLYCSSTISHNVKTVGVYTSDIEKHIINTIKTYGTGKIILGYIAWLSNKNILQALKDYAKAVLFMVNTENYAETNPTLLERYKTLPTFKEPLWEVFDHLETPLKVLDKTINGKKKNKCSFAAVRCIGNASFTAHRNFENVHSNSNNNNNQQRRKSTSKKSSYSSLLHSKCMIFCDNVPLIEHNGGEKGDVIKIKPVPYCVLTGSFNMTEKAKEHLENVVVIEDPKIAMAYFIDFSMIFLGSQPLPTK